MCVCVTTAAGDGFTAADLSLSAVSYRRRQWRSAGNSGGGRLQSVPAAHRTATAWRVYDSFYYRTTHMLRLLSTAETADVTQSASP